MLDPSYLRSIRDGILLGNIEANNNEALPDGLVGLYDQELFPPTMKWKERKETLHLFLVFALAQKEISADFAAKILGDMWYNHSDENNSKDEKRLQRVNDLVQLHSKRFSSAGGGKYRLYHERFRVYVLQKVTPEQIMLYNDSYILTCQEALQNCYKEIEPYALQYLSFHSLSKSLIQKDQKAFLEYYETYNLIERQKKLTKSYALAKKDLELKLKYSFFSNLKQKGYKASIELLSVLHKEQQSIEDFNLFLVENNFEGILQWLDNFKGLRQLKVIFLLLHQILIKDPNEYTKGNLTKTCEDLIDILLENENNNGFKWTDYVLIQFGFKIQVELKKIGVENYKLWRHEIDINNLSLDSKSNLDVVLRILKESNSDNYYSNIEKLLLTESELNDFNRIEKIINSIEKDGVSYFENSFGYYQNEVINKYLFQINCLNEVIRSNNSLSSHAYELQKKIIYSIPAGSLKLKAIKKIFQYSNVNNWDQESQEFYSAILDSIEHLTNPNEANLLLSIYPLVLRQENISNKVIEMLKILLKTKSSSEKTVDEIAKFIEILKLKDSKELKFWIERKKNILIELDSKKRSRRRNPFLLPIPSIEKSEDYRNILLVSALESKDIELLTNILKQLFTKNDYVQSNFNLITKCYKFLKESNSHAAFHIDESYRELYNESKLSFNEILTLTRLHRENVDIKQNIFWSSVIKEYVDREEGIEELKMISKLVQLGFSEYNERVLECINSLIDPLRKIEYKFHVLDFGLICFEFEELINEIDDFLKTVSNDEKYEKLIFLLNKTVNHRIQSCLLGHLSKYLLEKNRIPDFPNLFSNIEKLNRETQVPDELNDFFKKKLVNEDSVELNIDFIKFIKKFFSLLHAEQLEIWQDFESRNNRLMTLFVIISFLRCSGKKNQISDMIIHLLEYENQDKNDYFPKTYDYLIQELLN